MKDDFLEEVAGGKDKPGPVSRTELALRLLDDDTRAQAVIAINDASGTYPAKKVAAALTKRTGISVTDYMIRQYRRGDQELPDDL